ncbi:MAG: hypothetical protein C0467_14675 [Planctomycetaceae bacterium]|nr:hypothetical protein [Planctomycetaceae bacterium]
MLAATARTHGSNPMPLLAAVGLALAGFFVAVGVTNLLGYGKDMHLLRVIALALPLFLGGVVAFGPRRSVAMRVGVLFVAVLCSAAAWVFTPCELKGMSLAQAATQADNIKAQSANAPTLDNVARAEEVAVPPALTASFPSLAARLQPSVDAWANAAAERVVEQYQSVRPDNANSVTEISSKAYLLTKYMPQTRETVATAERAFSDRSARFWANELNSVASGNFGAFLAWIARCNAVTAILPNADILAKAEVDWVDHSVNTAIERYEHLRKFMPARARDELVTTAKEIQVISKASADRVPFQAARQKLFDTALARTRAEVWAFIESGAYDRAFGVARTHAVEWSAEASILGPEATQNLSDMREGCRYLAAMAEKIGELPDAAPPPRTKP